jgi:NADPH:quinone reductase-like Zn-dependent oxidoreductase
MKAVYITRHGGGEVLTYGDRPEPVAGPNDVVVRVKASAVNRLDLYTRMGARGTRLTLEEPHILGGDAAGDVVEVGSEVAQLRPGDRVVVNPRLTCGQCRYCVSGESELCAAPGQLGSTVDGSYAEYVRAPAVNAVALADSVSYEEAASLPTVFLPSWTILVRRAALRPWETALILSASSGVGTAAVQVAKSVIGARVIATTSTDEKARMARELGADDVINYNSADIEMRVKELTGGRGADVVLDHVGADFWPAASRALAPGGRYGICGATTGYKVELQTGLLFLRSQTVFGAFMGRNEDLRQIVELVARGTIRAVIHETFALEDVARAHEVMESRNFFGKLVVSVP